jgi:hypothetical protein
MSNKTLLTSQAYNFTTKYDANQKDETDQQQTNK